MQHQHSDCWQQSLPGVCMFGGCTRGIDQSCRRLHSLLALCHTANLLIAACPALRVVLEKLHRHSLHCGNERPQHPARIGPPAATWCSLTRSHSHETCSRICIHPGFSLSHHLMPMDGPTRHLWNMMPCMLDRLTHCNRPARELPPTTTCSTPPLSGLPPPGLLPPGWTGTSSWAPSPCAVDWAWPGTPAAPGRHPTAGRWPWQWPVCVCGGGG
jgi:hypothetical protein